MKTHETMTLKELRDWFEKLDRGEIMLRLDDEPMVLLPEAWANMDMIHALKQVAEATEEIFRASRGKLPDNGLSGPPMFHIMRARFALAKAEESLVDALNSIEKQKAK